MLFERVLAWLPFATLAAMMVASRLRAVAMRRQGVRVIVWGRSGKEYLYDKLLGFVFLFWLYLLLADAWPLSLAWLPEWLTMELVVALPAKLVGALLLIAAPALFAGAVRSLGTSWRMGVDRQTPGPLVTTGLFAWSRNPIYAAFDLTFVGAFLIHGRVVYLLLAVVLVLLLHGIILREERFLAERFGEAFAEYCRRVGRYGVRRR
jgi:protein-S-isoprenylcysteine O-methyltransferase Ste14